MYEELKTVVERTWDDRALLAGTEAQEAVRRTVELVDKGALRCAEPVDAEKSEWRVNEWVKKAVILYFPIQPMRKMEAGELEWFDKMELKHGYEALGVRAVPHAVARYGAYIAPGAILMPSYVNIGAYVGAGTMVAPWATVGSCAQIGEHVHLSGGVGARMPRSGLGLEHRHHGLDAHHRRDRPRAGDLQRLCAAALGGCTGQLPQAVPCRRIQRFVRLDYRPAQGIDRQENVAQRRPARIRCLGVSPKLKAAK